MDFKEEINAMAAEADSGGVDDNAVRVLMKAEERHNHVRDQLQVVLAMKHADIVLDGDDDRRIKAGTEMHKGILLGIQIALNRIGEFPITIVGTEESREYEDED